MKHAPLLVINALFVSFLFSCKKDGKNEPPPPEKPKLIITAVSPESVICGDTVTIIGKNFGTDTSKILLTLSGDRLPFISLSDEKATFVVPAGFVKSGKRPASVALRMGDQDVDSKLILIAWLETKGWYYSANIPASAGDTFPIAGRINFVTDSIGFLQREERVFRSDDAGLTWTNVTPYNASGGGYAFYSFDGTNAWVDSGPYAYVTKDGGKDWKLSASSFEFSVRGLFMSSPTNGLVVSELGKLYKVNGSIFDKSSVSLEFTSVYFGINAPERHRWHTFSALDEQNLIITGRSLMPSDNKYQLTLSHRIDGHFNEYNIGYVTTATSAKFVQMVSKDAAYLIDANNDILKYTHNVNWIKLNQKATALCFIDANTGYAAYDGKIIKTTDGGTTWKDDFSLKAGERIFSLFAKNGKIWAAGIDATQQSIVIKFNP